MARALEWSPAKWLKFSPLAWGGVCSRFQPDGVSIGLKSDCSPSGHTAPTRPIVYQASVGSRGHHRTGPWALEDLRTV